MEVLFPPDDCYGRRMKMRVAMVIMGLAIGPAFGSGVEAAKKLVLESKKDEVDVMKVLDLVSGDLTEKGVDQVLGWAIEKNVTACPCCSSRSAVSRNAPSSPPFR
ncbi:MAG: hypothetical protein ACON38_08215 [Akkermansiaceae bacterium]